MDHKINVWPQNIKLLEENIGETFRLWIWWWFLGYDTKGIGNRRKNRQMDFIEMKKYIKKYYQVTDNLKNWRIYLKMMWLIKD